MSTRLVNPSPLEFDALISLLSSELLSDEVVAMATDTVFGLVGRAASCVALESISAIKGRPPSVGMPVIIGERDQLDSLLPGSVPGLSRVSVLLDAFWPGPLTVVLPLRANVLCDSFFTSGTVGIRLPDDKRLQALAQSVGPLVATSANKHGLPTLASGREVLEELGTESEGAELSLVLDETSRSEIASSVIDATGRNFRLIREGAISEGSITKAFRTADQ